MLNPISSLTTRCLSLIPRRETYIQATPSLGRSLSTRLLERGRYRQPWISKMATVVLVAVMLMGVTPQATMASFGLRRTWRHIEKEVNRWVDRISDDTLLAVGFVAVAVLCVLWPENCEVIITNGPTALTQVSPEAAQTAFAPQFYRSKYSDVGHLNDEELDNHFATIGMAGGRQGSPFFNAPAYLKFYPDLEAAYGPQGYQDATRHWMEQGYNEGRLGNPDILHSIVGNLLH